MTNSPTGSPQPTPWRVAEHADGQDQAALSCIQVGVGNRGSAILNDILTGYAEQFKLIGLVDIVPDYLAAARARPGLAHLPAYASLGEALAALPQAAAVFVVTPARFHYGLVHEALRAGKHVWVEKPLTYDYAEALALAELAHTQRRAVVVGNQYQYHPLERQLQHLIRRQVYGKPFFVSYTHHRWRPAMRAFTGEYPALWEQGVHALNSILALLDTPELRTVYALGQRPPHSDYRSDTLINLLTEFADGTQAHLLVTFDSHRSDWEIRVECADAALYVKADGWQRTGIQVLKAEQVVDNIGPVEDVDDAARDPYAAFFTAATTGQLTPTSIELNLRTIQWLDAAVRSLHQRRVITLN